MDLPVLLFYGFAFIGLMHSVIFSYWAIRNKNTPALIITLFLFIQSLIILEYVLYWTKWQEHYHQLCNISMTTQFLFGPLLLLYVDAIFSEKKKSKTYLLHFTPAIIVFILQLPYYLSTAENKLRKFREIDYFIVNYQWLNYFLMAHMVGYCVYLLFKIRKEKRVGHINKWLAIIVSLFGVYVASYISYYVMVRYPWFTLTTDYFVSLGMCASIVSIIYFAYGKNRIMDGYRLKESLKMKSFYFSYKEDSIESVSEKKKEHSVIYKYESNWPDPRHTEELPSVPENVSTEKSSVDGDAIKYKNSGLTIEAGNELAEALKQLMQKERLYRESEIKLETLAAKLDIPKHYISQVINQYYKVNFFEYINLLRIEEAKQLLADVDRKSMNIIEVAYAVGYNTKNTFNSAFRRIVGVTPTEYRQQCQLRMN
jgi:AraC-like DNA-binding protein